MTTLKFQPRALLAFGVPILFVLIALPLPATQVVGTITGQVQDGRTGQPVASVQIFIADLDLGALSQANGRFLFQNVPAGTHTVTVERIGYGTVSREVTLSAGETAVENFNLTEAALALDEIIVTGTAGGTRRRAIGNDVTRLDVVDIQAMSPVVNMEQVLSARVPGLLMRPQSGHVGGGAGVIRIRGSSSIGLGNDPIIYIDGVRVNTQRRAERRTSMSRLDDINPEDIASIEVIKGPAAATLYGTEAANGVIQIITKRGTEGEPTFDASVELGANWMRDPYSETKSYTNWGYSTTGELLSMNMLRAYEERHGGQSLLQYGPIQKYSLSVAGGTPQFRYFASANHIDQEGIVDWNSDKRSTGRLSLSITPSDRLDITLNTSVMTGETKEPGTFWGQTMRGSPRTAADHGGVENRLNGWGSFAPDEYREFQDDRTGVERSNITLQVSFNPVDWLQNRLTVGRDLSDEWTWNLDLREPEPALSFFGDGLGGKSIAEVETKLITFDYSGTATFDLTQQLGSATSIGLQYYGKEQWSRSASGDEFATAALTTVGATAVQDGSEDLIENVTLGFYVQEQFDWEDRIFVTGAVRFDDNSAFGRNFDAAVYPKVSATWVLSEESFWDFDLVNMFRARAAWGQAGQQPDVFDAQRLYEAVPGTGNIPFLTPTSFGNEDLGPEKSDELEVGFDTGLWNDRVEVAFTYYTKRTTDAIVDRAVAPSFGIPGRQLINVGKVVNWGSELLLDVDVLTGNPLQWNMRFSFATMNNEIKNLGGAERIGVYRSRFHVEGYPLSSFFAEKVVSADLDLFTPPLTNVAKNILCDGGTGPDGLSMGGQPVDCDDAPLVFWDNPEPTWSVNVMNTWTLLQDTRFFAVIQAQGGNLSMSDGIGARMTSWKNTLGANKSDDPILLGQLEVARRPVGYYNAGYIALNEVGVQYQLPSAWAARIGGSRASMNASVRNLAMLWRADDFGLIGRDTGSAERILDPRVSRGDQDFQGTQDTQLPLTMMAIVKFRITF